MKLVYQVNDNFGDRLNEFFWHRAAPGLLDDDTSALVLGMGTIFNEWFFEKLDPDALRIIIGSGSGDKGPLPSLTPDVRIYGVRGPLTASYFGLGQDMIIGDPAILLSRFSDLRSTSARQGVGFMPHCHTLDDWDWETTCKEAGLIFVNPRGEPHEVIRQISSLKSIVTEAMHGAIVADAVRTPWTAVRISHRFWASKWSDWAGAVQTHILLHQLPQLRDLRRKGAMERAKETVKRGLAPLGLDRPSGSPRSRAFEVNLARNELRRLAFDVEPQLSKDAAAEAAASRIEAAINRLMDDKAAGLFTTQ